MTVSMASVKAKGYRRRFIFNGWDNFTDFEKEQIEKLKQIMLEEHGVDMNGKKEFGPRTPDCYCYPGTSKILPGTDYFYNDSMTLKYLVSQNFDLKKASTHLLYQLEWR